LKSYFSKKGKAKEILISDVKVKVEPPPSSDAEPVDYDFKNLKKIKISKNIPSFLINIDGEKPKQSVKKFPELPAGEPMSEEDVAPDP